MWGYVAAVAGKALLGAFDAGTQQKAAMSQNKAAMTQLAKGITQINLQRTASRQRTAQALYNTQLQSEQAQSQIGLQAAASGTIGASVQDAVSTVNVQSDRQEASIWQQQMQQEESFKLQTEKAIDTTHASMVWQSGEDMLFNNMLSLFGSEVGSAAANYLAKDEDPDKTSPDKNSPDSKSFGYDLWGSKGEQVLNSWKSYLGG